MTAQEILDEIRMLGGRLEARGDRLHVDVPAGTLSAHQREALAAYKRELLTLVRENREDCELEDSMRRLESARISIAVWEDGSMRVLVSEGDIEQATADSGTVYTPADMWHYIQLEPKEERMLHAFKKRFGGVVEWKG